MRVYNVSVYNIDQFDKIGNLEYIDNVMVTMGMFYAREIVTGQPFKIVSDSITSKIDISFLTKYGYVVGIKNNSLSYKNVVIDKTVEKYRTSFLESNFLKFLRKYEKDPIDQDIVDYRINKVLKKMKDN